METTARLLALALVGMALAGCATARRDEAASRVDALVEERRLPAAGWQAAADHDVAERSAELLAAPLTREVAVRLAFLRNPRIREAYAALGVAQAEFVEASRLPNPTLAYARLAGDGPGRDQVTRAVTMSLTDLLMLPARRRFARAGAETAHLRAGDALVVLASEVEAAWHRHVAAKQVAKLRDSVARAQNAEAEFARQLHAAGNLPARALAIAQAAASEGRVAAAAAGAEATTARFDLAQLIGISTRDDWDTTDGLAAVPAEDPEEASLLEGALANRLDAAALRKEIELLGGAVRLARGFRWLGALTVGYERETETDGERLSGPTFELQLPIFNQGQAAVLRAESQLEEAEAGHAALELEVRNDIARALDALSATREIAERYRTALIPAREAVVARTQEEVNFMLADAFDLLQAKRDEYDAYQAYLEAVRDHWIARAELRRAAGGALPDDGATVTPALDPELLGPAPDDEESHHDHSTHSQEEPS